MSNLEILENLERLAQAFPWDEVEIVLHRKPEGTYRFSVYMPTRDGVDDSLFESGDVLTAVVQRALARKQERDPEIMRRKAIAKLQEKLSKLQTAVFGLPPYVPNRELCERNPDLQHFTPVRAESIDV